MTDKQFEYEVAFSFHNLDEDHAGQLNDRLQGRFRTFLYSKQQDKLSGADGEETFNRIFGSDSRCVVVFYRKEWGETPFTRIEQTAIRNRAYDEGYEFALFIPTDDYPAPLWLPKARLWYGLRKYGLNGAAAAIDLRIQELGGDSKVETFEERGARLQRTLMLKDAQEKFRTTEFGATAGFQDFKKMCAAMKTMVESLSKTNSRLSNLNLKYFTNCWVLFGLGPFMKFFWFSYTNTLNDSRFEIEVLDGAPMLPGFNVLRKPHTLKKMSIVYRLLGEDRPGYELPETGRNFLPEELANYLLQTYMDSVESFRRPHD